jgi:hypothetical protein
MKSVTYKEGSSLNFVRENEMPEMLHGKHLVDAKGVCDTFVNELGNSVIDHA